MPFSWWTLWLLAIWWLNVIQGQYLSTGITGCDCTIGYEKCTIYLHAILNSKLVAGHSGQYSTMSRSEMRSSKMVWYSASFVFFTTLPLPDLCVRNSTIAFAAFVTLSNPEAYNRSSCINYYRSFQLKKGLCGAPLDHVRPRNSLDNEAQWHVALLSLFCAPRCRHHTMMTALAAIRGPTRFLWSTRLAICTYIRHSEQSTSLHHDSPLLTWQQKMVWWRCILLGWWSYLTSLCCQRWWEH